MDLTLYSFTINSQSIFPSSLPFLRSLLILFSTFGFIFDNFRYIHNVSRIYSPSIILFYPLPTYVGLLCLLHLSLFYFNVFLFCWGSHRYHVFMLTLSISYLEDSEKPIHPCMGLYSRLPLLLSVSPPIGGITHQWFLSVLSHSSAHLSFLTSILNTAF